MPTRLSRLAPLTGVAFAVLAAVAFASSQPPPGSTAGGAKVIAFYVSHSAGQKLSDYCWFLAFVFLLLFAGSLRHHLRRAEVEALGSLALAGCAAMTVGAATYFGFDYTLAVAPGHLDPGAAQALNLLALNLTFPIAAGGCVFGIAAGLALLRSHLLPAWLGWVAIGIGIVMATPGLLIGIAALILWSAIAGVLTVKRSPSA